MVVLHFVVFKLIRGSYWQQQLSQLSWNISAAILRLVFRMLHSNSALSMHAFLMWHICLNVCCDSCKTDNVLSQRVQREGKITKLLMLFLFNCRPCNLETCKAPFERFPIHFFSSYTESACFCIQATCIPCHFYCCLLLFICTFTLWLLCWIAVVLLGPLA